MSEEIKRGFNVYLYYWAIIALAFFIVLNYFSRNVKIRALDVGLMISVVSFLFGFLINITFSMLLSRINNLKETLAIEAGRLTSLFLLSKKLGKSFHEKITDRIDDYTIKTLKNYTNYAVSGESIYELYEDSKEMEIKNTQQETVANSFFYILGELTPIREKLEYLTARKIEWSLRFSNYLLGTIIIILLFLNRGDTFTNILFIILSTIIVFVLLIIEDYDSLRIGDYTYNISNSEQIFDLIKRPRYYPREILNRVKLEKGKKYRIGISSKNQKEKITDFVYK